MIQSSSLIIQLPHHTSSPTPSRQTPSHTPSRSKSPPYHHRLSLPTLSVSPAPTQSPHPSHPSPHKKNPLTHLCLCFGFLLQIIYTYFPFFLRTLLHPSHSFLTELRTFIPLVCCCCVCSRKPLNRELSSAKVFGFRRIEGRCCERVEVWIERAAAEGSAGRVDRRVCRSGRRRVRGSIAAAGLGDWAEERGLMRGGPRFGRWG